MKKNLLTGLLVAAVVLSTLPGCGKQGRADAPQPTKAVLTLSTTGALPAQTQIGGTEVQVLLPAGVTVKASPNSSNPSIMVTDINVVSASGAAVGAESVLATYLTSTASVHTVSLQLVKSNGFPTGEFATMNCDIAAGSNPAASNFSLAGFRAVDLNGADIPGLTAGFSATIE